MNQPPINEDLLTRWIDGQLTPEEAALLEQKAAAMPELLIEKESAGRVGDLLRRHLPVSLEPPSPEFFTSRIMEEIRTASPAPAAARPSRLPAWLSWMRAAWFAPLASAAAVAVAFIAWNHRSGGEPAGAAALTYTPNPRVIASSYFSEEAGATVIDLSNLDPVPDDQEIRAFELSSAEPPEPGEPVIFYAASDRSRPVAVLSKDSRDTPRITAVQ